MIPHCNHTQTHSLSSTDLVAQMEQSRLCVWAFNLWNKRHLTYIHCVSKNCTPKAGRHKFIMSTRVGHKLDGVIWAPHGEYSWTILGRESLWGLVKQVGFEPGVKKRGRYWWREWRIDKVWWCTCTAHVIVCFLFVFIFVFFCLFRRPV